MSVSLIDVSGNSENCATGVILTNGVNTTATFVPVDGSGCVPFVSGAAPYADWSTRWDDITYYTASG